MVRAVVYGVGNVNLNGANVMRYTITVTNDCPSPRFAAPPRTFPTFATREEAQREADRWSGSHVAAYNRVLRQNVQYRVVEA